MATKKARKAGKKGKKLSRKSIPAVKNLSLRHGGGYGGGY